MHRRLEVLRVAALSAAVGAGCGDDVPNVVGGSSGGATSTGPVVSTGPGVDDGGDASSTGDDGPVDDGSTGFEPPPVECGNGFVEAGEQCDDGNRDDEDDCNNACQVPCGLDVASLALPPTDESVITADHITVAPDDGAVVAGLLRRITTDQRGNEDIEPDVAQVLRYDPAGRLLWETTVDNPLGGVSPDGVVADEDGAVYVAMTGDDPEGADGIIVVKLAADDGEELWRHTAVGDVVDGDDRATGVALGADGSVMVAGQVRVGEGDDDIWVRSLGADDGAEVWSSAFSGVGSGSFSTDDGGPVAVDTEGRVWVLGTEYVDFETRFPVLLRFAADGGEAELVIRPMLAGTQQDYFVVDLEAAADGSIDAAFGRDLASTIEFRIVRYDDGGREVWTLTEEAFATGLGDDWRPVGMAASGNELLVAGRVTNDVTIESASWNEVWVARVAADAGIRCQAQYRGEARGLLPPSITAAAAASATDSTGIVSGLQTLEGDTALWVGRFRSE